MTPPAVATGARAGSASRAPSARATVRVIVNPAAGRGRGGQMLPRIREVFATLGVNAVEVTGSAGDERAAVRSACL